MSTFLLPCAVLQGDKIPMQTILRFYACLALIAAPLIHVAPLVPVALCVSGCGTVWDTTVTINDVVKRARENWADLSVRGLTTPEFDQRMIKAINDYRKAAAMAVTALEAYKASGGSDADYVKALRAARAGMIAILDILLPALPSQQAVILNKLSAKATTLK